MSCRLSADAVVFWSTLLLCLAVALR